MASGYSPRISDEVLTRWGAGLVVDLDQEKREAVVAKHDDRREITVPFGKMKPLRRSYA